jgi:predicted GNAT family N-acyltransferase
MNKDSKLIWEEYRSDFISNTSQEKPEHYKSVDAFREFWLDKGVSTLTNIYGGNTRHAFIRPNHIIIKKEKRKQGLGTAFMNDLISYADSIKMQIRLNPSDELGATSKARLERFYKRFGFVENKGRYKDFAISEKFYRDPK